MLTKYTLVEIESIEEKLYNGYTYDLEVEEDHSYTVDGIAVHNSACTTRVKAGVGYPQLSAIIECADAAHGLGGQIIGDGGCTNPGDVAKAFGGGCFTPEMQVQTSSKLKPIIDIKIGDIVKTHTFSERFVINKYEYDFDGELVEINGIRSTPNHEYYAIHVKYKDVVNEDNVHSYAQWISAENLTEDYLLIDINT